MTHDVLDLLRGNGENEREADKQEMEQHNEEYIGRDWSRRALEKLKVERKRQASSSESSITDARPRREQNQEGEERSRVQKGARERSMFKSL